jgi:hypothetical protein
MEKRVAAVVRSLRANKFPVFQKEVMKWAEDAIADTEYAAYFAESKSKIGRYKGWLRRM